MRLLLLGADGQLGSELRRALAPLGTVACATRDGRLDGDTCERADLDAPGALRALVERLAPDVVVNAAAYTAVDRAESERAAAFRANAEAPAALAGACARAGARLVHYSTDYVFDGNAHRPYREEDPAAPLGVYGASKLAGEDAVRASAAAHLIIRTAWLYAGHGSNFMRTVLRLARERGELRVVADQVGNPTPAALVAGATAAILAQPPRASGTWHVATAGETSWHGFASAIVERALARGLLQARPKVTAITTAEYPAPARRPAWSCLDCARLQRDFGVRMPHWRAALEEVLV